MQNSRPMRPPKVGMLALSGDNLRRGPGLYGAELEPSLILLKAWPGVGPRGRGISGVV